MAQQRRVDFFTTNLDAGGNARSTTILANEFVARGYDTRMVTLNLEHAFYREHIHPSIPVTSFDKRHVREALGGLAAYLRESQPQVILSQYSYLTVALVLLRELHSFPTKIIGVEHGNLRYVRREHADDLWRGRIVPALIRQFTAAPIISSVYRKGRRKSCAKNCAVRKGASPRSTMRLIRCSPNKLPRWLARRS